MIAGNNVFLCGNPTELIGDPVNGAVHCHVIFDHVCTHVEEGDRYCTYIRQKCMPTSSTLVYKPPEEGDGRKYTCFLNERGRESTTFTWNESGNSKGALQGKTSVTRFQYSNGLAPHCNARLNREKFQDETRKLALMVEMHTEKNFATLCYSIK
ncbi:hypothetical protein OUZ56_030091 [Daphnia magna]|uniref:Ig-like domain-containing protein n=1 Tax=Daphnia magna TaxID=35525 RepID=A0ABQ9ZQX7_9CRUS|nr:hypothetical protein OUZ56_030091 [Daphnia magna]